MKKKLACLFILALGITLSGCGSVGGNDVSVSVDKIDFSSFSAEDKKLIELNGTEAKMRLIRRLIIDWLKKPKIF